MTAERSAQGLVTPHLLPSRLQAPTVSSVLVLPQHPHCAEPALLLADAPKRLWGQGYP